MADSTSRANLRSRRAASISDSPWTIKAAVIVLQCLAKSISKQCGLTDSISQDDLLKVQEAIGKDTKMRVALIVWDIDTLMRSEYFDEITKALRIIRRREGEGKKLRRVIWGRSKHSKEGMSFEEFTSTLLNDLNLCEDLIRGYLGLDSLDSLETPTDWLRAFDI
ncbi:hypothetical protein DTO063F5_3802 [Paecilomyces variotii]|nr:hypothetical protein DTO063F5_3802 [Paecilomyces variotii]